MKRFRNPLILAGAALLCACEPEAPESSSNDLALPVTAPIKAREHLRQEVRKINVVNKRRGRELDAMDPNK